MPTRNVALLRRVADVIEMYPEHHAQADFYLGVPWFASEDEIIGTCGATACIAGWAFSLSGIRGGMSALARGGDLLGLTEGETMWLFFAMQTNDAAPKILRALADGADIDECRHIKSLFEEA